MGSLYLIRHGQASFGTNNYDRLSDLGWRQAALAGRYVGRTTNTLRRIMSGSLLRQRDTAKQIARSIGLAGKDPPSIQADARLNEIDLDTMLTFLVPQLEDSQGELAVLVANMKSSSRSYQLVLKRAFLHWQGLSVTPAHIESWDAFSARVSSVLGEFRLNSLPGDTTVVVTSGGVIAAMVQQVLELPPTSAYSLFEVMMNCSITRLLHDRQRFSFASFNECFYLSSDEQGDADLRLLTYR